MAGGRIDEELKVRRLIPSDGTISIGSHGSHYIPLRAFQSLLGSGRKSSGNPLRNKRVTDDQARLRDLFGGAMRNDKELV
jgi:hypothetical protein